MLKNHQIVIQTPEKPSYLLFLSTHTNCISLKVFSQLSEVDLEGKVGEVEV